MENENNGVQGMPQGATPESEAQAAPEAVQQAQEAVQQVAPEVEQQAAPEAAQATPRQIACYSTQAQQALALIAQSLYTSYCHPL